MPRFEHFAGVDWSGAKGARQKGIAVAVCPLGAAPPRLIEPEHCWSRQDVLDWLVGALAANTLVGLDLSMGLPFADAGAYFPEWEQSPADARALWRLVDAICAAEPNFAVSGFVDHAEASQHFRRQGRPIGRHFAAGAGRMRIVENRQRAMGVNPVSCFNLVGAAQVGKSSLTGMRVLHALAGRLAIWPFDAMPESGSLVVEIYTSIAARAAGVPKGRTKLRNGAALDRALAALGSAAHAPLPHYTDHATDAILTAAWLRHVADDTALWAPAGLDAVRATEGWTFGVR